MASSKQRRYDPTNPKDMRCPSKWKWTPSQQAMTCDDTAKGRVNHEVNRSRSLRCVCHSCDWPSCPQACGEMKGVRRHERAEGAQWVGWVHTTGVGVAVGVPSPPPANYTGHDRTGWHMVPPCSLRATTIWYRVVLARRTAKAAE